MTTYILFKVKAGKRATFEAWCQQLMGKHKEESAETLVEEGLKRESCCFFGEGDDSYVVFCHEAHDKKLPANLDRELNREHFRVMEECLTRITPRTTGYDISEPV